MELGVASGASSLVMLNATETYGGANVYACDITDDQSHWEAFKSEQDAKTGFVIKTYFPQYLDKWKLYTPGLVSDHL